ncbi:Heparinase II/III-like protein [Duganella sacchari]|uniref:Heparinase II/III-like protein n=1 Tax=Duganella sacchari TaxID=551987 RepID=A0A1M7QB51_9BURK|nr:heparinase II/III family protein [Duganella sacchari]SHN27915.1 Heparinase II/III-like protein [Duganella sacchari]
MPIIRHLNWLLLGCLLGTSARAELPAPLVTSHPHLLVNQARFDSLKSTLPVPQANFPAAGGSIEFDWTPQAKAAGDTKDRAIFGYNGSNRNTILIRHLDSEDTSSTVALQFALLPKTGQYVASGVARLPLGQPVHIRLNWDSAQMKASYVIGNAAPKTMSWNDGSTSPAGRWAANEQIFNFDTRLNEQLGNFLIKDLQQAVVFSNTRSDFTSAVRKWQDFTANVDQYQANVPACVANATPTITYCNVAKGHPVSIFQVAEQLSAAYKLSGDPKYLSAARSYIDLIDATDNSAGGEYSMGGRVAALGILYDWLYAELDSSYRARIATKIERILTRGTTADLSNYLCDTTIPDPDDTSTHTTVIDCKNKPVYNYQDWNRFASPPVASLAPYYLGGHQIDDVGNASIGLLAIAAEHPRVLPLIDTLYSHYEKGFWPAKAYVSADGGHQMGFGYSLEGNIARTIQLWRSAFDTGSSPAVFQADWQNKMIYPYIYGLRGNRSYPSRGDNYDLYADDPIVAKLALLAASQNNDGIAQAFYTQQILSSRSKPSNTLMELLYFPQAETMPSGDISNLELSRIFHVAGTVIARDSWDYANATVLDFKASNFSSDNHQHWDQNSFGLFYKAPLLIDSGFYDDYNSAHRFNYSTRTIAHNTLTVFKPDEVFKRYDNVYANDGGQWYPSPSTYYPTLGDIQPDVGTNYQDGIVNYEYDRRYTYVRGNASKAYVNGKLDRAQGFLRSIVFLPSSNFWSAPVMVVFDAVRPSMSGLETTFLLHSINEPAASVSATHQGGGRYLMGFSNGAARQVTVRNQGGMATIQTLLPENAAILKVGGTAADCLQADNKIAKDCRFTVRDNGPGGVWRNYAPGTGINDFKIANADAGAWRLEIGTQSSVQGQPQFYLHVISVADNDNGTGAASPPATQRLPADSSTEAVCLGVNTVLLFNRNSEPATSLSFVAPLSQPAILATGLKPETAYVLLSTAEAGGTRFRLQEATGNNDAQYSSKDGVIKFNF